MEKLGNFFFKDRQFDVFIIDLIYNSERRFFQFQ